MNENDTIIEKRLKKWCDALLELSRRNPTLNFQSHAKTGRKKPNVFQVGTNTDSLYLNLVFNSKPVSLTDLELIDESNVEEEDFTSLFTGNNLVKKFTRLKRDAESILEERGTHVLYLTFGMYSWSEEKISDSELKSPLLFVPINIVKSKNKDRFSIQVSDMGDVEFNPTFSYILKKLYKLDIESKLNQLMENAETPKSLEEILAFIELELSSVLNGQFSREAWIAKFWFEKLVLFSDIQKNLDTLCKNTNIRNICGEGLINDFSRNIELDVLSKLAETRKPIEKYEVLDADSSQRIAIEAAINNRNFILIGPPGTGKSQTITNIIAECLARGKKVLFVSEKLAALKVVERKLKDSNLGRFCLSIHGRDVKKKDFYSELFNWYETLVTSNEEISASQRIIYQELADKKDKLNDYASALASTSFSIAKTIRNSENRLETYDLNAQYIQSRLIELSALNIPSVKCKIDVDNLDEIKYKNQLEVLERTLAFKDIVLGDLYSDWFMTKLDGPFTTELNEKMHEDVKEFIVLEDLFTSYSKIKNLLGFDFTVSLNKLQTFITFLKLTLSSQPVDALWMNYEVFQKVLNDFDADRDLHNLLKNEKEELQKVFRLEILNEDLGEVKRSFTEAFEGDILRFINKDYWINRQNVLKYKSRGIKQPFWIKDEDIFEAIDKAFIVKKLQLKVNQNKTYLQEKYSAFYKAEETDWDELKVLVQYMKEVFSYLLQLGVNIDEKLPIKFIEYMSSSKPEARSTLKEEIQTLQCSLEDFNDAFLKLEKYFDINVNNSTELKESGEYFLSTKNIGVYSIEKLYEWASKLSLDLNIKPSVLERWFYYKKIKQKIDLLGLEEFIRLIASEYRDSYMNITLLYEKRLLELLYMQLENRFPSLANFSSEDHTLTIEEFRDLDKQSIELNKKRLFVEVSSQIKDSVINDNSNELKLIKKLGNQKHPRMPIRKAVSEAGNFFLKLKPCWMMSPISVSQYLPPDPSFFDVVIFDEASQVRPADSIGSIFRAKQVIVVGDPRQLPPTSFFQKITQEEEDSFIEDEEDGLEESIIDEIKSKATDFIELPLRWHYRSKSEDLFAFANKHIYGDLKLVTFPNPSDCTSDGKELGVRHILVEDGIYDRGNTRTNQIEADKVADLVIEHFANNPSDKHDPNYLSLGVIAFSSAQEKAIVDALYRKKKEFSFIESILDDREGESFFIKNLETVQGDERDHIIISVGYGPDKEGKINNNFGPVNQEGGERRLNVAITRAKRNLILVSSFTHKDVFLNSNQKGPNLLVKYIQYAIEGKQVLDQDILESTTSFASVIDEIIYKKLMENGIQVKTNFGTSELKLNMVVENPFVKDSYLFAIESDGPAYYKNISSRDRDRLKYEILNHRGWEIKKVWTKEWLKDSEIQMQELQNLYNKKLEEEKQKIELINNTSEVIDFDPFFSEEIA